MRIGVNSSFPSQEGVPSVKCMGKTFEDWAEGCACNLECVLIGAPSFRGAFGFATTGSVLGLGDSRSPCQHYAIEKKTMEKRKG